MVEVSKIRLHIRAISCEACGAIFHEIPEAEVENCPHCGDTLYGQTLLPQHINTAYELRVDQYTGQPYLFQTETGKRLDSV